MSSISKDSGALDSSAAQPTLVEAGRKVASPEMKHSMPPIFVAGASYKTASIELLEHLALNEQSYDKLVQRIYACLRTHHPHAEVVALGTCNRIEIYWTQGSVEELYVGMEQVQVPPPDDRTAVFGILAAHTGVPEADITAAMEVLSGGEAIEHLFRVASGAESMVVGEHQILGQVEDAWESASRAGTAGPAIGTVFAAAVRCGRRARRETPVGRNPRDVSTVAVQLAENVVGGLGGRRVLVVGVGEMGRLTVKALHHRGLESVDIVNRGEVRAREAAERWGATPHAMEELPSLLEQADIMIASTGSSEAIIDRPAVEEIMQRRSFRPLVLIDLAMPRDVAPDAGGVRGVHLFDLDGLREIAEEGERERREAIPAVEVIVADELGGLRSDLGERAIRPVLSALWSRAEGVRQEVLQSAQRELGELDPAQRSALDRMSRLLTNKLLHSPSARLRSEANNGRAVEYAEILAALFGLREGGGGERGEKRGDQRSHR